MEPTPLAFLFLDESMDESLDLASLTGVLVPSHAYREVRDALCKLVWEILAPAPNTVPAPIELHGRNLLPELAHLPVEQADAARLRVLQRIVGIVNDNALRVFRVCYLNRVEIAAAMRHDPKLYGINFFGIQAALQDLMEQTLVVPVMDGVPNSANTNKPPAIDPSLIRAFAGNVRWLHHTRQSDAVKNSLSVRNAHNLGEPVFADSTHATMLQMVDLVSYLILQLDRDELAAESTASPFKQSVVLTARTFHPQLLELWRGRMQVNV